MVSALRKDLLTHDFLEFERVITSQERIVSHIHLFHQLFPNALLLQTQVVLSVALRSLPQHLPPLVLIDRLLPSLALLLTAQRVHHTHGVQDET